MNLASLVARYQEPHREHHNLDHILYMLALYGNGCMPFPYMNDSWREAIVWSVWYHDAIYDPTAHNNEELSALLAEKELVEMGVDDLIVLDVMRLVRSTITHAPVRSDELILSDLDLAILGAPRERYKRYAVEVRGEYSHVPSDLWRNEEVGRPAILRSFLERPQIFQFLKDREVQARSNMNWELSQL